MLLFQGIIPIFLLGCHASCTTTTESGGVTGPAGTTSAFEAGPVHTETEGDASLKGGHSVVSHNTPLETSQPA